MKEQIVTFIKSNYPKLDISVDIDTRRIVFLKGNCESLAQLNELCHRVASIEGVESLVSDLTVPGMEIHKKDYRPAYDAGTKIGVIDKADVVIVGGGITGCGIARELSRYNLKIILLEKDDDVACGASKANNGDIHSGYLEKPGTLKAQLNVKGNAMYTKWAEELNFHFRRLGNLLVLNDISVSEDLEYAENLARQNHVPCQRVSHDQLLEMEPIFKTAKVQPIRGLFVPTMGTVDPWEVTIALAENAVENGCIIRLNCTVCGVEQDENGISAVVTEDGIIETKYLINCAGIYADDISEMAGDRCFTIHPRKGTIAIIDKSVPSYTRPVRILDKDRRIRNNKNSKGGGMATTIAGNNLLGPSAEEVQDKEDMETTPEGLKMAMARSSIDEINNSSIIRFFSGTRAATYTEDFYIRASERTYGLINVAGIQSPGLTSSPAIAELVIDLLRGLMVQRGMELEEKPDFNPFRKGHTDFASLSHDEQDRLIKNNPAYGHIICRCEHITEGEILDVLHSPIVPTSIDAIKRRTRAGMGRCQGGFCQPRVLEILARELGKDWTDITLKGRGSNILVAANRSKESRK